MKKDQNFYKVIVPALLMLLMSTYGCHDRFDASPEVLYSPIKEGTFGVQTSNHLIAWNSSVQYITVANYSFWTWQGIDFSPEEEIKELPANEYAITLWTKEHSWEEIRSNPDLQAFFRVGDKEVDAQIIANAERDNLVSPIGFPLSYRLEKLSNFKIYCEQSIFGQKALSDITEKFVVYSNTIVINSDKHYLGPCPKYLPLSEYLALEPLVFDSLTIVFNRSDAPVEKIKDCRFIIELKLDNNKTLSAATKPVSFI